MLHLVRFGTLAEREFLTLKEAAAAYGTDAPGMSRLVRRLRVHLYPNPRDGRSKLVNKTQMEQALDLSRRFHDIGQGVSGLSSDTAPVVGSPRWRRHMLEALEVADRGREKIQQDFERRGITPLATRTTLDFVRGEIELDDLP